MVNPDVSTIDPPLPLSADPIDAVKDPPAPLDPSPVIKDIEPPLPDVALPVENDKSPLTPLVPASTVFITTLPELVSVLKPEAIVIDPP
jgi:hypothetical protein